MADMKSRGGEKKIRNTPGHTDEQRYKTQKRDMAEDAQRGQQGNQGGYHENKPQSGKKDNG